MLWLLFGRSSGWTEGLAYREMLGQNINMTPFFTIRNYLHVILHHHSTYLVTHCVINLLGNILLFIPAGWLLPKIWKKQRNFFLLFLTCALSILLIEVLQLFTLLGSFDVDDLILNLFGMTMGFIGFRLLNALKKK
jgi:glycopeptide antibiotics resistance protein